LPWRLALSRYRPLIVAGPNAHLLLLYVYIDDMLERRGPFREDHLAWVGAEREAGRVIMAGALGDPPTGAAIVFRGVDPEHVEEFVVGDPYMESGLILSYRVETWNVV